MCEPFLVYLFLAVFPHMWSIPSLTSYVTKAIHTPNVPPTDSHPALWDFMEHTEQFPPLLVFILKILSLQKS